MLMGGVSRVIQLRAASRTLSLRVSPVPSSLMTMGFGRSAKAKPESSSDTVHGMLTAPAYQPFEPGAGDGVPSVTVGGVESRFTVTLAVAVPPDEVAVQVMVSPAVSCVTVVAPQPLCERMGDCGSVTAKLICGLVTYQSSKNVVPITVEVMIGGERSMSTSGVVNVALLPAWSVTTTCTVRCRPSPVMTTGLPVLVV